jgi:outer membrane receptor protein involved in Fe transport
MFKLSKVCRASLIACLGSSALFVAQAQTADDTKIEIVGSRIRSFNTDSQSPIVVMTAESIKSEGIRSVEGLLNNLPQVFADYGGSVSNGATGTATVNLRNLGANRTLVLVDGKRLPAGSPRSVAADLNQIPVSMISRVEILTGGASAVYGADAVAGVVNIVLKKNFSGVEFESNYSFNQHNQHNEVANVVSKRGFALPGDISNDGNISDFSFTVGGAIAEGKGNTTINFSRKTEAALLQSQRDFSSCTLGVSASGFSCGGSSTSFPGRFYTFTDYGSLTVADANGTTRPYVASKDQFNYGPVNYFQRPSTRNSVTALAHYDINDQVRVYTQLAFHDDSTVAQIAPSGLFGFDASGANAIKFENPLLSADWKSKLGLSKAGDTADLIIYRRNIEGGGRQDDIRHTSYRGVIGAKGDFGAWSYDASLQQGKVVFQETYKNDFSIERTAKALDIVVDPTSGKAVCRSFLNGTDPNCVPYNIWSLGKIDKAALAYLQTPGFQKGGTTQSVATATVSGDLGQYGYKLPWAKNGVGVAFGVEKRTESLQLDTDTAFTTGDLAGQGGPTIGVGGKYSVNDVFGEIRIPLAEKQPNIYAANLNASYRHSTYSSGNTTSTWGTGVDWAPVKDFKVRSSVQQAARSPNVVELFSAQSIGLYNNDSDPCAGDKPAASLIQCARTGVSAAQYGHIPDNPAGQYNALSGGNPSLKPETSRSLTMGFIASPAKDLTVSFDYFQIKIDDAIGALPATTTLNQCLATGDPKYCSLITRDRLGSLWALPSAQIVATNLNIASYKTKGFDLGGEYTFRLNEMGKVNVSFLGTVLQELTAESAPGLGSYDCAGLYGATCGTPAPKWRHKMKGVWSTPWGIVAGATWRYFGSVNVDTSSTNPQLAGTVYDVNKKFAAISYLDLSMSYPITKNVTFAASINNLLDKDPPLSNTGAPFGNGNTYPVVYDALGRKINLNLTAKF